MKILKYLVILYCQFVTLWFVAYLPGAIEQYIKDQHTQIKILVALVNSSSDLPIVLACAIDHLWYQGKVSPMGLFRSMATGGSDHAPVFADFNIN